MGKSASPTASKVRCAIYTRKSSEEGLDQDFNSLHAQREACEAYVRSQVGEGWRVLPQFYDDGGYSGGTIERPALQRLLGDIDRGAVDIVVVYKIDRLTRSLMDFAKIVDRFDAQGASFVSVTQSFNTTTSMGRLTLNVLLSFAQFEREVTGERIRDKLAASKKKGMWMGGNLPLGYDADGRTLKINEAEADQVRHIFRRYVELRSVHVLCRELEAGGLRSKRRTTAAGKEIGGVVIQRGALFHMLTNRVYLGEVPHKGESYPGLHPAIIAPDLFAEVQQIMQANRVEHVRPTVLATQSPLTGKLFGYDGEPLTPTKAKSARGRYYRYYVSASAVRGIKASGRSPLRLPASKVEALIMAGLQRWLGRSGPLSPDLINLVERIDVSPDSLMTTLARKGLNEAPERSEVWLHEIRARLTGEERAWINDNGALQIWSPAVLVFRGGQAWFVNQDRTSPRPLAKIDPGLASALRKAHNIAKVHGISPTRTTQANAKSPDDPYDRKLVRLAYLAPDIQERILTGRHAEGLFLQDLLGPWPLSWSDQRKRFGL